MTGSADEAEVRDIAWLISLGFCYLGDWATAESLIHRDALIRGKPDVYAFVVIGEVRYIGKTTRLHSRLRSYGRRSFNPTGTKPLRRVHNGIVAAVATGFPVSVYARVWADGDDRTIEQLEAHLIELVKPVWNGNGYGPEVLPGDAKSNAHNASTEAANRAEVTALLICCGYRVYRSEADIDGEDLVVRTPAGELRPVQLKGRPTVEWKRYGGRGLWMLFPSAPWRPEATRTWFLVPHDTFFAWVKARHGHTPKWGDFWSYPNIGKDLAAYLTEWAVRPPAVVAGVSDKLWS